MTEVDSEKKNTISVVYYKPGECAETVEMEDKLEVMQELVGGLIQEYMPFHSETDDQYDSGELLLPEDLQGCRDSCRRAALSKTYLRDKVY